MNRLRFTDRGKPHCIMIDKIESYCPWEDWDAGDEYEELMGEDGKPLTGGTAIFCVSSEGPYHVDANFEDVDKWIREERGVE